MFYGLRRKLILVRMHFWKWLVFSAQVRKDQLTKKMREVNVQEELLADRLVSELVDETRVQERFERKVWKQYLLWKAYELRRMKQDIGYCENCGRTEQLTIDHIIPQAVLKMMGIDPLEERDLRNFQLLCKICNGNKKNYLDFSNMRTKPLLLEYLKRVEGSEVYVAPVHTPEKKVSMLSKWEERLAKKKAPAVIPDETETEEERKKREGSLFLGTKNTELSPSDL
jgi:hypothetical protein